MFFVRVLDAKASIFSCSVTSSAVQYWQRYCTSFHLGFPSHMGILAIQRTFESGSMRDEISVILTVLGPVFIASLHSHSQRPSCSSTDVGPFTWVGLSCFDKHSVTSLSPRCPFPLAGGVSISATYLHCPVDRITVIHPRRASRQSSMNSIDNSFVVNALYQKSRSPGNTCSPAPNASVVSGASVAHPIHPFPQNLL